MPLKTCSPMGHEMRSGSVVHRARMEATHFHGLNRRGLAQGSQLRVQLTKQTNVSPRQGGQRREETNHCDRQHNTS